MNIDALNRFLQDNSTCVIARVNRDDGASAATVGFSHDEQFKILIGTNKNTRKFEDIKRNPKVAIVVGVVPPWTVQYEGIAEEKTEEELGVRLEEHFKKVPAARNFVGDAGQTYFLISPTWLRFRNIADESHTFEMEEF